MLPGGGEPGRADLDDESESADELDAPDLDAAMGEQIADRRGEAGDREPAFFEFAGPLFRVDVRPRKATMKVGAEQTFSAVARDKSRRTIDAAGIDYEWLLAQGSGSLSSHVGEFATYRGPAEPELAIIKVRATQDSPGAEPRTADAEAIVTVTAELLKSQGGERGAGKGLPGYTFAYLPGALWRSRYDSDDSLITINSGHPDFVHASRQPRTKLRYVARLYAKEIVLANFPGAARDELLERLVELTLYMDDNLR